MLKKFFEFCFKLQIKLKKISIGNDKMTILPSSNSRVKMRDTVFWECRDKKEKSCDSYKAWQKKRTRRLTRLLMLDECPYMSRGRDINASKLVCSKVGSRWNARSAHAETTGELSHRRKCQPLSLSVVAIFQPTHIVFIHPTTSNPFYFYHQKTQTNQNVTKSPK